MLKKIGIFVISFIIISSSFFGAVLAEEKKGNTLEDYQKQNEIDKGNLDTKINEQLKDVCSRDYGTFMGNFKGGICDSDKGTGIDSFFTTLKKIIEWTIGIAFLLAVFAVLRAGGAMIFSFGDTSKYTEGKNQLKNAVIGIALIAISFGVVEWFFKLLFPGDSGAGYLWLK